MSELAEILALRKAERPVPTRANPPGLTALSYRGGRYSATLRHMLQELHAPRLRDTPLARLNCDVHDDWTIALVHAWAVATEVLGFYQERIINEGYLRTATEERSLLELGRAIGYEPHAGVAARAQLAFTVLEVKEDPARRIFIPARCAVLSVPPQGQLPQTFETDEPFTARAEWNLIRPRLAVGVSAGLIRSTAPGIRLAGVGLAVQPGDRLLLVGAVPANSPVGAALPADPAALPPWLLAEVTAVTPDVKRNQTTLSWKPGARGDAPTELEEAQVFALRPPAGLFTYSSGGVYLRGENGAWGPASLGMPGLTVRALARADSGALIAATDKGLYRSADGGASWQPAGAALGMRAVHALAKSEGGMLYAGGEGGLVARSADGGTSWTTLSGELLKTGRGRRGPLPRTVVRALAVDGTGGRDRLLAGTDDGALRSRDGGRTWEPANAAMPKVDPKTGLAPVPVRALATLTHGRKARVFAATDAGVFRVAEPSDPLVATGLALLAALVLVGLLLLANPTWLLSAQLGAAIKRFAPIFEMKARELSAQIQAHIGSIAVFATAFADALLICLALLIAVALAGWGRRGLARRPPASIGAPVSALAPGPDGRLYAATEHGLLRSNDGAGQPGTGLARADAWLARFVLGDGARAWQPVALPNAAGEPQAEPTGDEAAEQGGLLARARALLGPGAVKPSAPLPGSATVSALATGPGGELLVGLAGGTVRHTTDGQSWVSLSLAPQPTPLALLPLSTSEWLGAGEWLVAGAPPASPTEDAWSPWHLRSGLLDLAVADPALRPGDLLLLRGSGGTELRRIASVALVESGDPARPARLTRVQVSRPEGLERHRRGSLGVSWLAHPFELVDECPLAGQVIPCAGYVPDLAPQHVLAISGRRARALAPASACLDPLDGSGTAAPLSSGEPLVILAMPTRAPGDKEEWRVRTRDGRAGLLRCAPGALALAPAHDDDETVSELVTVQTANHDATRTTITLEKSLANVYDRGTVTIHANVVRASHGATVTRELLGSSESMSENQRFFLNQAPLTYLATRTGVKSSLEVTVNGVRWDEAPFLHAIARNHRVFMVRRVAADAPPLVPPAPADDSALAPEPPHYPASELIFGDGVAGAGLPTGTWQIEASYRSGIGTVGNLPAGSLSLLQRAPRGLKAVTNPLPADGGVDPEVMAEARLRAPLDLQALGRIVSPADIASFARAYPGVSKVRVDTLSAGPRRLLHLTIADADGGDSATSRLADDLAEVIAQRRASPSPPVYVSHGRLVRFAIKARLLLEAAHQVRAQEICAEARAVLIAAFSFAAREIGQPVAASELISRLQAVAGVAAVELHALRREDDPSEGLPGPSLTAEAACIEDGRIVPAELLLIDASAVGIGLETTP